MLLYSCQSLRKSISSISSLSSLKSSLSLSKPSSTLLRFNKITRLYNNKDDSIQWPVDKG